MATIYRGRAKDRRVFVTRQERDTIEISARESQKVWNHSPDGFSWGYGGSGPAQLALALLIDRGENHGNAVRMHQDFKQDIIAALPMDKDFSIYAATIDNWIGAWQKEHERKTNEEEITHGAEPRA